MNNDDKMIELLKVADPELAELRERLQELDIPTGTILDYINELSKVIKSDLEHRVSLQTSKGKIVGITTAKHEEDKGMLGEAMSNAGIDTVDLVRGLYLMANIRRFTKWGKVTYLLQDGKLVRVQQEQGYKL